MVMLFPDLAERTWPYGTTNGQYGNFYGTVIREVNRDDFGRHYDCNKQVERITEELEEAKAALKMVDYTWARSDQAGQYAPRGACCLKERAPNSRCQCSHRTPGCYENPYCKLGSKVVAWDCGHRREPEFLEDHIRAYHPRLAPKMQFLPKCSTSKPIRCELRGGSVEVRPVGSGGGFGVGLQAGLHGSGRRKYAPGRSSRPTSAGSRQRPVLPAAQRYGYYRYYGAAGQGAKTSADYHRRS